jgi:hypothetical protein
LEAQLKKAKKRHTTAATVKIVFITKLLEGLVARINPAML